MKLYLHPSLVQFTDNNQREYYSDANSLKQLFNEFFLQNPRFKQAILVESGLSPFVNVYVNGQPESNYLSEAALSPNDEVELMTALVGG